MKFDKTRVYTAVNADELKIGSLIIAALNLEKLERKVESEMDIQKLEKIAGIDCGDRFGVDIYHDKNNLRYYPLAYLVEPPKQAKKQKESQYKPFSSMEKAKEIIDKHGGWIKRKEGETQLLVIGFTVDGIFLGNNYLYTFRSLYFEFIFIDDGSPCGELVEE